MPGNNKSNGPSGTRRLVAPELLPLLEFLPSIDFNEQVLHAIRAGMGIDAQKRPPLSPEQQAVACEQRFIPGPPGAPDVRLLVYTPPGPAKKIGAATKRPASLHMHGGG
jgi:acetyl esterase/lipase